MVETSCKKCKNKEELYPTVTHLLTHTHTISSQAQLKSKAWVIRMKLSQSYGHEILKPNLLCWAIM